MGKLIDKTFKQAAGFGMISGMRATIAPALVSHFLQERRSKTLHKSNLAFLESRGAALLTKVLSLAEITGDKIPGVPDRTSAPQLVARMASGAFVGGIIAKSNKDSIAKGVVIGGIAALASTYATFYLRKYAGKLPYLNDAVIGATEELIAIKGGAALMNL